MQPWSQTEVEWLIQNYNKFALKELAKYLPNRPYHAIRKKGKRLGLGIHRPLVSHPIDELSEQHLGYFVGLIEGEGTITVEKWKYKTSTGQTSIRFTPLICIANTSYELLANLKEIIKSGSIKKCRLKEGHKQGYLLRIRGYKPTLPIIDRILPHLIVKKKVAECVKKYIQTNELNMIDQIRSLNKR